MGIRWAGRAGGHNAYKPLNGKPEGRNYLEDLNREGSAEMDLKEIRWESVD
jgi:hypothetical protein